MELAVWVREIEPWTWNWMIASGTRSLIIGGALCGLVGLVLGHINGYLHAKGTIYKAFGGEHEAERKPVQSVSAARGARAAG